MRFRWPFAGRGSNFFIHLLTKIRVGGGFVSFADVLERLSLPDSPGWEGLAAARGRDDEGSWPLCV